MGDDLDLLIAELREDAPELMEHFDARVQARKFGWQLQFARKAAGLTQAQVAARMGTRKSAISRMENHADDIRLSTLQRYADALGCHLLLELRPDGAAGARPARRITRPAEEPRVAADGRARAPGVTREKDAQGMENSPRRR